MAENKNSKKNNKKNNGKQNENSNNNNQQLVKIEKRLELLFTKK